MATTSTAGVINVTRWGAIPNDSGDDSWAIRNAIDGAPDGSTIYFPKGTYLLSGVAINHRSGLKLSGDGSTLTILRRHGRYASIFVSTGSTDMLITNLGFDTNGVPAFGGFSFHNAKRITITKNHFFDSNKQPVDGRDRYAWVFARGSVPSEDILISDNLIEDLQLEVDFSVRVRIEGNTIVRPVQTTGIGVFTLDDYSSAQDYTIQKNTIVDPAVSIGGIVVQLDPPSSSYSTIRAFRIVDNQIVYTKDISADHPSAIRFGTGAMSEATKGNIFDDIVVQNNVAYKDPGSPYDFFHPIVFGVSSATANFKFDNTEVSNNVVYYNNRFGMPVIDIRQKGVNYLERNNRAYAVSADIMPPSVPTALTATYVSDNQIHLAWNASIDNVEVYKYCIYRNGLNTTCGTDTSYVDKNLAPGAVYSYTVTAVDTNGNESDPSYSVTSRTTSGSPASTPIATTANTTVSGPTVTVTPKSIWPGGTFTATWNANGSPTSRDWLGLYLQGTSGTSHVAWMYVSCSKTAGSPRASGSCPFTVPSSTKPGTYELRLMPNGQYTSIAKSTLLVTLE